jgi:hypothetical protein
MTTDVDPVLTGADFDLANAGYTPMRDPDETQEHEPIGSDNASLREMADQRSQASQPAAVRQYVDGDGKTAPSNEAITLDRAARDYAAITSAEKLIAENKSATELAARIDALRAEALANDPDAAELYGFELPKDGEETVRTKHTSRQPDVPDNEASSARLDPEVERALRHPQVLQAIQQQVDEAERARQSYHEGLTAATQIAQASFLGQFPELAATPPENLPAALELMSRQDPARFARVKAMIATAEQLFAEQAQQSRHQSEMARQNFLRQARSEDARLETMLKGEPVATQQAVISEIMASARESGIEPAELNRLFATEPLMRNATFQRMMYDAGKYRLMMKARDAAVARPVPPVQRPGMATTRSERERADLRTLSSRLSASGDIKDAVALYQARKSGKR